MDMMSSMDKVENAGNELAAKINAQFHLSAQGEFAYHVLSRSIIDCVNYVGLRIGPNRLQAHVINGSLCATR